MFEGFRPKVFKLVKDSYLTDLSTFGTRANTEELLYFSIHTHVQATQTNGVEISPQ